MKGVLKSLYCRGIWIPKESLQRTDDHRRSSPQDTSMVGPSRGILKTWDGAQQEDHGYRSAQEEARHHVRGVMLVVHDARASDRPRQTKLQRP